MYYDFRREPDDARDPLAEFGLDQASRPHIFVNKVRRRFGGYSILDRRDAPSSKLSFSEVAAILTAAEFAASCGALLDMHVTLDFARLGVSTARGAWDELSKFTRRYAAWCGDALICNPAAWIASIERCKDGGYHAHVALHVDSLSPLNRYRRDFRAWARGYSKRNFGRYIPRAVRVRGGLKPSVIGHWLVTTYIAKGCDGEHLLVSARNAPGGKAIKLKDLMPWHYVDPGHCELPRRISISNSLGPKARAMGTLPGWEKDDLPREPDLSTFFKAQADGSYDDRITYDKVVPKPFRSALEDRVTDVRQIYPTEFYQYVTKLYPAPASILAQVPMEDEYRLSELDEQLRALQQGD